MLTIFLWPNLGATYLEDIWLQQDGGTYHTAHETIAIMQEKGGEREIILNANFGSGASFLRYSHQFVATNVYNKLLLLFFHKCLGNRTLKSM